MGRWGGPLTTPPLALKQDMPQIGMLVAQRALAPRALHSGEKRSLPHHAQGRGLDGTLGLLLKQFPGHRPVETTLGSISCVLLGDAEVCFVLQSSAKCFLHAVHC